MPGPHQGVWFHHQAAPNIATIVTDTTSFTIVPKINPTQALTPTMRRAQDAVAGGELPQQRAQKRPEQQAGQPKKQPDQRSQQSAPHRARTGARTLRTQRTGEQIHQQAECADRANADQPPPGPGGDSGPRLR